MFIDYNLFGMNFIDVGAVKFRHPLPEGVAGVYFHLSDFLINYSVQFN